jgi:hypothetical protein
MRFFCYALGDETVPMPPPDPAMVATMDEFVAQANREGWLVATGGMGPSAMGAKVALADGEYTVTDGPFAEAKELVGGWAIIDVPGHDDAVASVKTFLSILGQGEYRLRPVFGPDDAPPAG